MTPQTAWLLAISAVVIVGVIAFFVGRSTAGTKGRIDELEAELARKVEEAERYRKEVDAHFDKTATLFVSMAGSYKELFEHLSAGYDQRSGASARERFQERVDALLPRRAAEPAVAGTLLGGAATAAAASPDAGEGAEAVGGTAPVTVADAAPAPAPATEAGALAESAPSVGATAAAAPAVEADPGGASIANAESDADADAAERVRRAEGADAGAAVESATEPRGEVR
ncbi:MAG: YhcB family protein [Thauera sp.]|nr:YhcB family protein [Thauera sp.]